MKPDPLKAPRRPLLRQNTAALMQKLSTQPSLFPSSGTRLPQSSSPLTNSHVMVAFERIVGAMPAATKRTSTREDTIPQKFILSDGGGDVFIRSCF
jgi:NIMA (never in mitosis gene a)-related kinase